GVLPGVADDVGRAGGGAGGRSSRRFLDEGVCGGEGADAGFLSAARRGAAAPGVDGSGGADVQGRGRGDGAGEGFAGGAGAADGPGAVLPVRGSLYALCACAGRSAADCV